MVADVALTSEVSAEVDPLAWTPSSTVDFTGIWVNEEEGIVRAFVFSEFLTDPARMDLLGVSPVYRLYRYAMGTEAELVQRGRYSMALGPLLVMTPTYATDGAALSQPLSLALLPSAPDTFTLQTPSGLSRTYYRMAQLP